MSSLFVVLTGLVRSSDLPVFCRARVEGKEMRALSDGREW